MSEENKNDSSEQIGCTTCKKKGEACISFLSHENAMMHKDLDNERSHKSNIVFAITVLVIILIFVIMYTVRMNVLVTVIKEQNAEIVKLALAKGIVSP